MIFITLISSQLFYNCSYRIKGESNLQYLSNSLLIEVYQKALEADLDLAFLELLVEEIKKREISIELLEESKII